MSTGIGVNTSVLATPTACGAADRFVVTSSRAGRPTGGHTVLFAICRTLVWTTCTVVASVGTASIADSVTKIHSR